MRSDFDIDLKLTDRPHGFITAYRPEYSGEQYRKMAELLEAEMKYSGLSYVKAEIGCGEKAGRPGAEAAARLGADESAACPGEAKSAACPGAAENERTRSLAGAAAAAEVFCLIDTRYPHDDFVRLMVRLCSKFRQERVLVTTPGRTPPGPERDRPGAFGYFYDARGTSLGRMPNVSMAYAWEYFGWIIGGKPEYIRILDEVATPTRDIYNWISAMSGHGEFQRKYAN